MTKQAKGEVKVPTLETALSPLLTIDDVAFSFVLDQWKSSGDPSDLTENSNDNFEQAGLPGGDTYRHLIYAIDFVYSQVNGVGTSSDQRSENFETIFKFVLNRSDSVSDPTIFENRLKEICVPVEGREKLEKQVWLENGLIEKFEEVESFVDLRPDFSRDRTSVDRFLISILLQIESLTPTSESRARNSLTVQLTEENLKKLKDEIEDIENKIRTLKAIDSLGLTDSKSD